MSNVVCVFPSVRYFGLYSLVLSLSLVAYDWWQLVGDRGVSGRQLFAQLAVRVTALSAIPAALYLACFYAHLSLLYKAGPNDNVMTSAFQASLEVHTSPASRWRHFTFTFI